MVALSAMRSTRSETKYCVRVKNDYSWPITAYFKDLLTEDRFEFNEERTLRGKYWWASIKQKRSDEIGKLQLHWNSLKYRG